MPAETHFRHDPLGVIYATRAGKVFAVAHRRRPPQDMTLGTYSIRKVGQVLERFAEDAPGAKAIIRRMK